MEYEIKPEKKFSLNFKEVWSYKELFYFFTWRDIKVKYKQTVLGFLWVLLQPLAMTILFSLSLGKVISNASEINMPYPLFALSGLMIWNIFSSGITNSGNSMITNSNIIKKVYFPRIIIPVSSILVSLFDFFVTFFIFFCAIIYYNVTIDITHFLFFMLISILIITISTLGLGCLLAALNLKYRDFRYIIPFLLQGLLFLSPIIYPISIITNQKIKYFLALNPIYSAIEFSRYSIIKQEMDVTLMSISVSSALFFLLFGVYYFKKTELFFADIV